MLGGGGETSDAAASSRWCWNCAFAVDLRCSHRYRFAFFERVAYCVLPLYRVLHEAAALEVDTAGQMCVVANPLSTWPFIQALYHARPLTFVNESD